jgi:glycerol-3-phosphate acyltransferase PlsY
VLTLVLFWRHRTNIRRLITGEETRIGGPGDPAA